ncbi:hypothetical protein L6Q96_02805 [Candidatus Binatia bacterium]|nr:hypothetical protein [Candidatus Binatia bacterium]
MAMPSFGSDGLDLGVIDHLLAGGEMVAAQLPRRSNWSPERKLAGAVLAQALIEVRDRNGDPKYRRRVAESLAWIDSDDTGWPFSFVPLCHLFGLEPAYVRVVVRRWLDQAPPTVYRQCSAHRHAA